MKKFLTVLLCVSLVFCFCACGENQADGTSGNDQTPDNTETIEFPLNEMYEANQAAALIEKYGTVHSYMEFKDPGVDEPFKTIEVEYENKDGKLQGEQTEILISGDEERPSYYSWFEEDGAKLQYVCDKGVKATFIYPDDDYIWGLTNQWDARYFYSETYEKATSLEDNGDTLTLKAHYESLDEGKIYDSTFTLNKENYEVLSMERTYFKATGEESFTVYTTNEFGGELSVEPKAKELCLEGDRCEYTMTMILDASGTTVEEHTFDISVDCPVYIAARGINFEYFADAKHKESVSKTDPAGDSIHYWAVCSDETHDVYAEGLDEALTEGFGS